MNTPEAVAAASAILSEAETAAYSIKTKLRSLSSLFKDIADNGDAGVLVSRASATRADALGTQFEADLWELHGNLTALAKVLNIDVPPTATAAGVHPLGGTR